MHDQPERKGENHGDARSPKSRTAPQKKRYSTPRLVAYGNLRDITKAKGGSKGDGGGVPQTRV